MFEQTVTPGKRIPVNLAQSSLGSPRGQGQGGELEEEDGRAGVIDEGVRN